MPGLIPCALSSRRGVVGAMLGLIGATMPAAVAQEPRPASAAEADRLRKAASDAKFSLLPQIAAYLKRLQAKFGPAVLAEVREATIDLARQWKEHEPIPSENRNLEYIVADWAKWTDDVTFHWVERSPQRLEVKVTRCRWAEEFKKIAADGETGFAVICASDYGYCAGLNPAIRFTRTTTIMQGDDHCNHCYELKA